MQSPDFRPHPLIRGGHLQTIAATFWPGPRLASADVQHQVRLDDGDRVVVHDDAPTDWRPGERVALLIHGLAGSHLSPYIQRIGSKLLERGVRVFRMDLRGAGAGMRLARRPYHSGCHPDAAAVVKKIARLTGSSPLGVAGFSLGANITLNLAALRDELLPGGAGGGFDRVLAVNPPLDLAECVRWLQRPLNRIYDRYFVNQLWRRILKRVKELPDAVHPADLRWPRSLEELDDRYTAPASGFASAADYYAKCSAGQRLPSISLPTLIITSRDDPFVPASMLASAPENSAIRRIITDFGGHLGYLAGGRPGVDPDRHWLDWRVTSWLTS